MYEPNHNSKADSSSAVASSTTAGVDRLSKNARSGIDAASDAAHPAIDRLASGAHKAVKSADEMAKQGTQALSKVGANAGELATTSANYVRAHPLMTLAIAVFGGYLLSRLFGRS